MVTRFAGEQLPPGFLPKATELLGEGCATKPEMYPAPVKPTMSHGTKYVMMPR